VARQLSALAPFGAMLDNPIGKRPLESNIATGLFGLDPLVFQNLLPLGLKFPVQRGILQQFARRELVFRFVGHNHGFKSFLITQFLTQVTA